MSFYSALAFVRPLQPPAVSTTDLAEFASRLLDTGMVQPHSPATIKIKEGVRVDRDDRDTIWYEPVNAIVSNIREIEWDVDRNLKAAVESLTTLTDGQRPIYRANLSFALARDVQQPLTREPGPENNIGFFPDGLAVQFGPIHAHDLITDPPAPMVGWIGARISGSGYFFPWTFREVVAKAESIPQVRRMMELCRSFWPVEPAFPGNKIVKLRQDYASLWAYDDFTRPWDWTWWPQETG